MSEAKLSAVAFLVASVVLTLGASLGMDLSGPCVWIVVAFQIVGAALLAVLEYRPLGFVLVWIGAIMTMFLALAPIDSSIWSLLASILFGSLAMLLWFAVALPIRALLLTW
ncbi:hypothetical protein BH09ACT10_BH09ACT10_11860 [soil metagenome]